MIIENSLASAALMGLLHSAVVAPVQSAEMRLHEDTGPAPSGGQGQRQQCWANISLSGKQYVQDNGVQELSK